MFTVAVLGSGGLLCTYSAVRAGWSPVWGTEICATHPGNPLHCQAISKSTHCSDNLQQQMWMDFTQTPCYGNTFSKMTSYKDVTRPVYLTAGPPCTFFCIGGHQTGDYSETGWMFADTALIILLILPLVFRVEQSGNVENVNEGAETIKFKQALQHHYVLHTSTLECWDHGDNVHRTRWFCNGFRIEMGALATDFQHPHLEINTNDITPYCGRDIAIPDEDVPPMFWRKDNTRRIYSADRSPGEIHKLARAAPGMGPPGNPNLITSWDGATPGPTTLKGGVRRPKLSWMDSTAKSEFGSTSRWCSTHANPVGPTRTDTPTEMCRSMSAPSDIVQYYSTFSDDLSFLYRNIGNAIAAMTCTAYDEAVMSTVKLWMSQQLSSQPIEKPLAFNNADKQAIVVYSRLMLHHYTASNEQLKTALSTVPQSKHTFFSIGGHDKRDCHALASRSSYPKVMSAMVDSGANRTFLTCEADQYLHDAQESNLQIQVASKDAVLQGSKDGTVHMMVLGPGKTVVKDPLPSNVTTIDRLERNLFSIDGHYLDKFNILLKQPDFQDGIPQMYKEATSAAPAITIPFRYDYVNGGFWIDYVLVKPNQSNQAAYSALLTRHTQDLRNQRNEKSVLDIKWLTPKEVESETLRLWAMTAVTEIFWGRHDDEREIRGVKAGLRKRKRELNLVDFHNEYDHLGCVPNCIICAIVSGSMRRVFKKIDPHIETRPMYYIHLDTISFSHRAFCGSKYEILAKDAASKVPDSMYLYLRSDSLNAIEQWVNTMRSDPAYSDLGYQAVQIIQLDNAGEWDLDYPAFQRMKERLKIELLYTCKDRKESNPVAERAIGIKEPKVKAALMQRNLPPEFWVKISKEVNWLMSRFPVQSQAVSVPIDGDRARPLEIATRGRYSRRQIDRELYYFVGVGTPCLVHNSAVKGSHLPRGDESAGGTTDGQKSRWMVGDGMYRDQVKFWDPKTNETSRSKSYTAFKLRYGMNFAQLLGIDLPHKTKRMRPLKEDFSEQIVIQLPAVKPLGELYEHPHGPPISSIKHVSDQVERPNIVQSKARRDLSGSVKIIDAQSKPVELDTETGHLIQPTEKSSGTNTTPSEQHVQAQQKVNLKANQTLKSTCYVDVKLRQPTQLMWDQTEAKMAKDIGTTTGLSDTFVRACKKLGLPFELHSMYRTWLVKTHHNPYGGKCKPSDFPNEKNNRGIVPKLYPHWHLPYPTGESWRQIKRGNLDTSQQLNDKIADALLAEIDLQIKEQSASAKASGMFAFSKLSQSDQVSYAHSAAVAASKPSGKPQKSKKKAKKRTRNKATLHGRKIPKTIDDVLANDDATEWLAATDIELDGLTDMGVFKHNQTRQDLIDQGIRTKPVTVGIYYDEKLNKFGEVVRKKSRCAVQGHRGNMQKGIHFFETYAATPQGETGRILCVLAILWNWRRRAWDIVKAYCWAGIPKEERLALAYPDGYKRYDPETLEELFMVLMKNLYGDPAAGRRWSIQRDAQLLDKFNGETKVDESEAKYASDRLIMDPCVFLITLQTTDDTGKKHEHEMLISIHTDDIDAIGSDDFILNEFEKLVNTFWTLTNADVNFMLGVERHPVYETSSGEIVDVYQPGSTLQSITLKMTAFVKGAVEAFKEHMPKKRVKTPYPDKPGFNKDTEVDPKEIQEMLDAGYQRLVGLLLWGIRHAFDEGKYGISMLCSVLSKPSKLAFAAGIHMLAWMDQESLRGVRFNINGNHTPICMSDASNKPLLKCGKCHAGYLIIWLDGPIASHSSRLHHVGLSSEHNEYMGMTNAIKKIVWLRQFMAEINRPFEEPTPVYGDNVQANKLCTEHFISPGNQYIATQYHFNKEKVESGDVIIIWVDSKHNIADALTKALTSAVLDYLLPYLLGFGDGIEALIRQITKK